MLNVLLLWIVNIAFDTLGQTAFKFAAITPNYRRGFRYWFNILRCYWIWIGLASYALECLLWLAFLSFVPLSMAILLASANMITVMLVGRLFFHERLTVLRVTGISMIAIGVILVGFG